MWSWGGWKWMFTTTTEQIEAADRMKIHEPKNWPTRKKRKMSIGQIIAPIYIYMYTLPLHNLFHHNPNFIFNWVPLQNKIWASCSIMFIPSTYILLHVLDPYWYSYGLRTQNLNIVAPISEQIGTSSMHFCEVWGGISQCIVKISICSGMGATNLNSKGPTNLRWPYRVIAGVQIVAIPDHFQWRSGSIVIEKLTA